MRSNLLYEILENASKLHDKKIPATDNLNGRRIKNTTHVVALLDYNGYVIASNQGDKYVGEFFGQILGKLMDHLANVSIFKRVNLDDTQAECPILDEYDSAANYLLTPAKIIIKLLGLLLKSMYTITLKLTLFIISLFQVTQVYGSTKTRATVNVSCVKTIPMYLFQEHVLKSFKEQKKPHVVLCKNSCSQTFALVTVKDTNLILIIAETNCQGRCRTYKTSLKHIKKNGVEIWKQKERYRRRPVSCFNSTVSGIKHECGRGAMMQPSFLICAILVFIGVMGTKL